MFAFAIVEKSLFMAACDPIGIKPLIIVQKTVILGLLLNSKPSLNFVRKWNNFLQVPFSPQKPDFLVEIQKTVTASEGLGDLKITEAPCDLYFSSYGSLSH